MNIVDLIFYHTLFYDFSSVNPPSMKPTKKFSGDEL